MSLDDKNLFPSSLQALEKSAVSCETIALNSFLHFYFYPEQGLT